MAGRSTSTAPGAGTHVFNSTGSSNDQLIAYWDLSNVPGSENIRTDICRDLGLDPMINHIAFQADDLADIERRRQRLPSVATSSRSITAHRLRFIRAAQATGFTLEDVTELLRPAGCGKVQGLIEERLEQVAERMKELRHVQCVLRASLEACRAHEASGRCQVVDDLTATARSKRP